MGQAASKIKPFSEIDSEDIKGEVKQRTGRIFDLIAGSNILAGDFLNIIMEGDVDYKQCNDDGKTIIGLAIERNDFSFIVKVIEGFEIFFDDVKEDYCPRDDERRMIYERRDLLVAEENERRDKFKEIENDLAERELLTRVVSTIQEGSYEENESLPRSTVRDASCAVVDNRSILGSSKFDVER